MHQTVYLNLICNDFQDGSKLRLRINNTKWSQIGNLLTPTILPIMITGGVSFYSQAQDKKFQSKISI